MCNDGFGWGIAIVSIAITIFVIGHHFGAW